ncbi:effector-associated constant component EACC1 [Roseomonas harenae]|uniref:effector-associated constant component EACC1 n=1 Tax=Muricoccus harenae TaxID=2692566 RepID=UPI001331A46B|nr:hypothetical protein [Roseomonas harenae]
MEIAIDVAGAGAVAETAELRDWLHEARIRGVEDLRQGEKLPGPGDQGPELLALLTVILAGPAVVELVRSIHRYIEARTPAVTITVKAGDRTVTIDSRNPASIDELVSQAERLAKS